LTSVHVIIGDHSLLLLREIRLEVLLMLLLVDEMILLNILALQQRVLLLFREHAVRLPRGTSRTGRACVL
jgi:hypothetical protein